MRPSLRWIARAGARAAGTGVACVVAAVLSLSPSVGRAGTNPDGGAPFDAGSDLIPDGDGGTTTDATPGLADVDGGLGGDAASTPAVVTTPPPERGGRIEGLVVDAKTGEGFIEAQVTIVQLKKRVLTDVDGRYRVDVPPGTYDVRVFGELRAARRVTNVHVEKGQIVRVDVSLDTEKEEKLVVEEVVVTATADTTTEAVQVVRRKKAATVSDAVSAEQIARSPDSTASDAAKRLVAATVQDNRYIIVRGLAGRYSLTLLNGVPLPSPDPDVPAAPLDIFPSTLLANLTVVKTFTPDIPGNFAGGAMGLETRTFPARFTLRLRLGITGDTQSTLARTYGYRGGRTDYLGYDDGTRALPRLIPRDRLAADPSLTDEETAAQARSFANNWSLRPRTLPPGLNLSATLGDTLNIKGTRLGYLATVSFTSVLNRRPRRIARVGEPDGNGAFLPSVLQLQEDEATQRSTLSSLLTVGWAPSSAHQLNLTGIYAHTTDDTASRVTGIDNSTASIDRARMRFLERTMLFSQLLGEHAFAAGKVVLTWQANLARVSQDEPDTRDLLQTQVPDGRWLIVRGAGSATRLFSTLADISGGAGGDLSWTIKSIKLKVGGSYLRSSRGYQARRFDFRVSGNVGFLPPDEAFSPAHVGNDVAFTEVTLPTDGYQATREVAAAYALVDVAHWKRFRILAGARLEVSNLKVGLDTRLDPAVTAAPPSVHRNIDVLPAVNGIYYLTDTMNLRAAYSITVARPNFREIAPALYFDYVRRRAIGGNPNLEETSIHNADLRWEFFPGPTEVLAASVFYKYLARPIERTVEDASDGQNVGFANSREAHLAGIELEARFSFGRLWKKLTGLSIGANLSLIASQIDVGGGVKRSLQGQSPFVVNVDLGYEVPGARTRLSLLYNVFGPRIEEVGTGGAGNVMEAPVHRLDLSLMQPLPAHFRIKLAATNLLNQRVVFTQNGVEILAYPIGVGFSATVEMNLE